MSRPRGSTARLMAAVLWCGVGFAALRHPTDLVGGLVFALAAGLVCVAALGAAFGGSRTSRRSWAGFAVFGGAYLLLSMGPNTFGPPPLPTTWLLEGLRSIVSASDVPATIVVVNNTNPFPTYLSPGAVGFLRVGHSLAAVLAGLLGALVTRIVWPGDGP